jgi:hypothetical protein
MNLKQLAFGRKSSFIVKDRHAELKQAREISPVTGIGKPLPVLA